MIIQKFITIILLSFLFFPSYNAQSFDQKAGPNAQQPGSGPNTAHNKGTNGTRSCSVSAEQIRLCTDNDLISQLDALPIEELTETEEADLLFMREEEKLARDAYTLFNTLWGSVIFDRISMAEQKHMDALLLLIDRYNLVDPIVDDVPGIFINPDLQALYDLLAASGSNSLVDALMAGAEIEEVDIADLQGSELATDNLDIQLIYDNLMKGSRNHLRSFVSNLELLGIVYEPRHLTVEEFELIINPPMERGQK